MAASVKASWRVNMALNVTKAVDAIFGASYPVK